MNSIASYPVFSVLRVALPGAGRSACVRGGDLE